MRPALIQCVLWSAVSHVGWPHLPTADSISLELHQGHSGDDDGGQAVRGISDHVDHAEVDADCTSQGGSQTAQQQNPVSEHSFDLDWVDGGGMRRPKDSEVERLPRASVVDALGAWSAYFSIATGEPDSIRTVVKAQPTEPGLMLSVAVCRRAGDV
jgi:hypothetical protein